METVFEPLPPSAIEYQKQQANGKAMKNLAIKREAAVESARLAGIVTFSVINFNPVAAVPPPGLIDYSVPAFDSPLGIKVSVNYRGKTRVGSIVVIENLRGHAPIRDARNEGDQAVPDCVYDWNVVQPIEQAKLFDDTYNLTKEQHPMGGILVFQGNASVLDHQSGLINYPVTTRLKDGSLRHHTKAAPLKDKLHEIFELQKEYTLRQVRLAHTYSQKPELVDSITTAHQAFAQFAVDMEWIDEGSVDFLLPRGAVSGCQKCGARRASRSALFCNCGHPYDAFAAYMKGMKVDVDILSSLPPEQLAKVKTEAKRRKQLAAELETEVKPDEKK